MKTHLTHLARKISVIVASVGLFFLLVYGLLCLTVSPVSADATITISGSPLSVTPQAITCTTVVLSGIAQTATCTTSAWTIKDPTGTGAGYRLQISATNFSDGAGHTIPVSGFKLTLADTAITTTAGNTKPASAMASATPLSTTAQNVLSAAVNTGIGTYNATPTFSIDVPPDTFSGSYVSTISATMVAGP